MNPMMKTATALSTQTVANFDNVIALAQMLANPKALNELRSEFANHAQAIQDAITAHEKAEGAASTRIAAATQREKDIAAKEEELLVKQTAHEKRTKDLAVAQSSYNASVQKLLNDTKAAKDAAEKTARDNQTKIDVASQALDVRAQKLVDREQAVANKEAALAGLNNKALAAQKKADDLIARYTQLVERVKSAVA